MPLPKTRLLVVPNPWTYIDHLGRPAGVVACDPHEDTPDRRWVGARIKRELRQIRGPVTQVVNGAAYTLAPPEFDIEFEFESAPVRIPDTGYYRDCVRNGELFAVDEATARACGVKFADPAKQLADAKAAAIEHFNAANGDDAFNVFAQQRAETEAFDRGLKEQKEKSAAAPAPTPVAAAQAVSAKSEKKGDA